MSKVALVTGGTRGIGRSITERLAREGYKVAANYAGNDEAAAKCAADLGVKAYKWDVGDYDACAAGIAAVTKDLGPVDVLVNNAGITRDATLHRMTRQQWDDVIRVDLTSVFNLCRLTIEGMRERNYGRIVNISSINGQKGQVGQVNYSAAKAGLIGFTKALAQENAKKGITVNVICPGYIDTEMVQAVPEKVLEGIIASIPVGRLGTAAEIAACVSFLSGADSGFITGATLTANGGQYITG
jgi:acetoacetyl-CoA reductase